ncbi:MAG: hypothetical protein ACQEW8_04475 [Actinomycetota bacterium]
MIPSDIFSQLIAGTTPEEMFETSSDAAVTAIDAASSLQQVGQVVSALLDPLDQLQQRIHVAGLLSRLAVAAVADATTHDEFAAHILRLSYICGTVWPLIDPGKE